MNKIDILLSTYNGENFLIEQLDSIINQTYENWRLFIRDDGSSDNTIDIIENYKMRFPEKITLIKSDENVGSAKSFLTLMKSADSPYVMFCDQDDIWLNRKIELSLNRMLSVETDFDGPVLVHTDLKVVDRNLNILQESFINSMNLNPNKKNVNNLLVQNNVTGCTIIINRKLYSMINDSNILNNKVIMHDWFITILCSITGRIDFINQSLILYRQHSNNVIGAKNINLIYYSKTFLSKIKNKEDFGLNNYYINQANSVNGILLKNNKSNEVLNVFLNLKKYNKIKRIYYILKYKLFKQSYLATFLFIISMIIERRND